LLMALFIFQFVCIGHRYSIKIRNVEINLPIWACSLSTILLNELLGSLFWWHLSGILTGVFLFPVMYLMNERRYGVFPAFPSFFFAKLHQVQSPFIRSLIAAGFLALTSFACILLLWRSITPVYPSQEQISLLSANHDKLVTFLVMSAPRPHDVNHLLPTLNSILDQLTMSSTSPIFNLFQILVFTKFSTHKIFTSTRQEMLENEKGKFFINWRQIEDHSTPSPQKQREDFADALRLASLSTDSKYIAILEDDFPLCQGKWSELQRVLFEAEFQRPSHCGVFMATGGRLGPLLLPFLLLLLLRRPLPSF